MLAELLCFPEYRAPAERLAEQLGISLQEIDLHHFPDGEDRVKLPKLKTEHLLIYSSLDKPNNKLIQLLLVCNTARDMGIKQITLVAPYLCYMRQDIAFHPGEAVSQKIIGQFLASLVDNLLTVDPHLHRTHELKHAVPCKQAINLSATRPLGDFLIQQNSNFILLGPDEESEQWVRTIAELGGFEYGIARKQRLSDQQVEILIPDLDFNQARVVLVDDMISTGYTMLETAQLISSRGASSIDCLVTHALHSDDTGRMLQQAGIGSIWSTDSIISSSNRIQLAELLAMGVRALKVE